MGEGGAGIWASRRSQACIHGESRKPPALLVNPRQYSIVRDCIDSKGVHHLPHKQTHTPLHSRKSPLNCIPHRGPYMSMPSQVRMDRHAGTSHTQQSKDVQCTRLDRPRIYRVLCHVDAQPGMHGQCKYHTRARTPSPQSDVPRPGPCRCPARPCRGRWWCGWWMCRSPQRAPGTSWEIHLQQGEMLRGWPLTSKPCGDYKALVVNWVP